MAIFRLGFRPFFLTGALFAALAIPLWIAALFGQIDWQPHADWLSWHRHEMLFGFGMAIIAGFLLTAVQNWTGRPGLSGRPLMFVAALWLAARLGWLFSAPFWLLLLVDLMFAPLVALLVGRQLWAVRQTRNYPIVGVLLLFGLANLISHLGLHWQDYNLHRQATFAALWLTIALITLIGGRVIPFFTQRGLGLGKPIVAMPWLDNALLLGTVLLAVMALVGVGLQATPWLSPLFVLLAAGHITRWFRWHRRAVWRVPLLWSLHLAYIWLIVALLAFTAWHFGWTNNYSQGLHMLTIGTMSGLILAMIARVSLGHTGRPLQPPAVMAWAFVLLNLAVPLRVWLSPVAPQSGFWLASLCWSLAFLLYLWCYLPMLLAPRVDGQPG